MNEAGILYLDLMKRCVTNSVYGESEFTPLSNRGLVRSLVLKWCGANGLNIVKKRYDPQTREEGRDWPPTAHTMIGLKRLDNLQFCVEDTLARGFNLVTGSGTVFTIAYMSCVVDACGNGRRPVAIS